MDSLFRFLVKYEFIIYVILGLGALFVIRSATRAWVEFRRSVYGLEKELALQRLRVSGAVIVLLLMIGLSQFCLVSFVVPFLPAVTFRQTATADLLQTPQVTLDVAAAATAAASTPLPPPGTTDCVPGKLVITFPAAGQEITGKITLTGSVDVPNFGFYKYEFARQGSAQWTTIAAGNEVKHDEELGAWDPSELVPGDYQLRLVVTDNLNNSPLPACIVPVRIVAPVPTP